MPFKFYKCAKRNMHIWFNSGVFFQKFNILPFLYYPGFDTADRTEEKKIYMEVYSSNLMWILQLKNFVQMEWHNKGR